MPRTYTHKHIGIMYTASASPGNKSFRLPLDKTMSVAGGCGIVRGLSTCVQGLQPEVYAKRFVVKMYVFISPTKTRRPQRYLSKREISIISCFRIQNVEECVGWKICDSHLATNPLTQRAGGRYY